MDSNFYVWSVCASFLALAYAQAGRVTEAVALAGQAVDWSMAMDFRYYRAKLLEVRGIALLAAGERDEARRVALLALETACKQNERGQQAWALRLLGELAARRDPLDVEPARGRFTRCLALAEELGMRPLQARARLGLADLYGRAGRGDAARSERARAVDLFRSMGMTRWLSRARGHRT